MPPKRWSALLPAALLLLSACSAEREPVVAVGMTGYAPDALAVLEDSYAPADGYSIRWELMDPAHGDRIRRPSLRAVLTWFQDAVTDIRPSAAVGPRGSRATLVVAPVLQEAGVPLIAPDATSDDLEEAGPNLFRLVPPNRDQGSFMALFAFDQLNSRTGTVFYVSDEYGSGLRDGIEDAFAGAGGSVLDAVPLQGEADGGHNDYGALVQQALLRGKPDVVFLACGPRESAEIVRTMAQGHPDVTFVAGDGMFDVPYLLSNAPEAAGRFYRVAFWHPSLGTASHDFQDRFRRVVGRDPGDVDALTYDALLVLSQAVAEVGSDPEALGDYLASLGGARPAVQGVSGPIAFAGGSRRSLLMVALGSDSIVARITP